MYKKDVGMGKLMKKYSDKINFLIWLQRNFKWKYFQSLSDNVLLKNGVLVWFLVDFCMILWTYILYALRL